MSFTCILHDSTGVKLVLYTQTLPPTQTKSSSTIASPPPHPDDIDGQGQEANENFLSSHIIGLGRGQQWFGRTLGCGEGMFGWGRTSFTPAELDNINRHSQVTWTDRANKRHFYETQYTASYWLCPYQECFFSWFHNEQKSDKRSVHNGTMTRSIIGMAQNQYVHKQVKIYNWKEI